MPGETALLLENLQSPPNTTTQIKAWTARDTVLSRVAERILSVEAVLLMRPSFPTNGKKMRSPWKMDV